MLALRASRISEAEWNARRQKLEKLYLDENLSRQDIIERMGREDNFFATEKQLKYQFNKWGLKKYVKDQDLTAMLSIKRKREELGKNTGFMYRGHLFDQERLERASKRRKGPLMSSPDLPPYIMALVSPRQSPQMHRETSAVPEGIGEATHASGRPNLLHSRLDNAFHQSEYSDFNDALNSLGEFSDLVFFPDSKQNQASGRSWEPSLDDSIMPFSPRHRLFMPTPSGQDNEATRTENPSTMTRQISSIAPYLPAAQSAGDNEFPLSDIDLALDFSMFLRSPHRQSTAPSSAHIESNTHMSAERICISPLQLTDHEDTHMENRDFSLVPNQTSVADEALDPVTGQDVTNESIASLLLLLKSQVFPRFGTASQKYEYGKSILSALFCADCCGWLCSDLEELLDVYLEASLRSIRKRRTARSKICLPPESSSNLHERRQGFEPSDGSQQISKFTEATVASKMRSVFSRKCSTPMGEVLFEVREEPSSPMGKERIDSNHRLIISFMPRAVERALGLSVGLSGMSGGPAIPPQISTFNVVPDDSAIIQCIHRSDLRGIQSLFSLGAASARDVDSRGISLLHYAMFTGCSDVFRLLVQGGASLNECNDFGERRADIITVLWRMYVEANADSYVALSMENVKKFEQCVAITQLALNNHCTISRANEQTLNAGPLFTLVQYYCTDTDASVLVDAIDYLCSIGWDLEEKNCVGQTSLLYAAWECIPPFAKNLRALIEKGARLDARDKIGRGPLLTALSPQPEFTNWVHLSYISRTNEIDFDNNWALCERFGTEDRIHVRDYSDAESIPGPLTNPSVDGSESSQLTHDQQSNTAVEQSMPIDLSISDSDIDASDGGASPCNVESISNTEGDDHVYCINYDGDGVWIRNPIHVIKDRVRVKLKILLEAGCDPNEVDYNGESANDYARRGLWPQWLWALSRTGYVFDEEQNRWTKWFDSA